MVLTGEVGAGKTTLLQALLTSVDRASTVIAHISVSGLDAETLANRVLEALGQAPISDAGARRKALLEKLHSGPLATLLVIDEAQHLDPSAFELLEEIANTGALAPARVQICLVGQPELRFLLNAAERGSFRELIDVDRHLRPLEQTEIRLYVEHRLHRAGWAGRPEFEDAAFVEIFIFTGGIPRRVNLLCNSLMLSAWLKRQDRIDAPAVARAAAALRGDSPEGPPDLLEAASRFEHPPTLTDAVERGIPEADRAEGADDSHPWSCPSCDTVNPTTLTECWKCSAARPSTAGVAESPSEAEPVPQAGRVPADEQSALDVAPADAGTSRRAIEDAPPSTSSGPRQDNMALPQPINARLAGLVQKEDPGRRRRKTILASVASMAVALAVIAYVVDRERSPASLSQSTLRDVVARRPTASSPAPAADRLASSARAPSPAASSSLPDDGLQSPALASPTLTGDAARESASQDSGATGEAATPVRASTYAAPELSGTAASVPATSPMSSCSGPAAALGLCDSERSSSTRRQ